MIMNMKKKLMTSILITIVISLSIITTLYMTIVNYQSEKNIQNSLKENNILVSNMLENNLVNDKEKYFKSYKNTDYRVTLINPNGKVIYDSDMKPEYMENHSNRKEIIEAKKYGHSHTTRISDTTNKTMVYYTSVLSNGYILRSSMSIGVITGFEGEYLKYYIFVLILVFLIAVIISSKLSYVIVKPIKDLEFITSRVANGELERRVVIISNDEIGQLAKTFNNMADKLQYTIRDSIEKQTKLESVLESMDSGVIAVDKKNQVIIINSYAKKIFGIDKDIIGENLLDCIIEYELDDIFNSNIDKKEIEILWPKRKILKVKTTDIINYNERIGTVAVVHDITDIRKLENMRTQFVANVSHELKTPLTSIKGFAETLKYVEDAETKEKFLDIINDESDRLTRLISDILILSDLEQHKEIIDCGEFELGNVIEDVYNLMKNIALLKEIDVKVLNKSYVQIHGNVDKFKQMLINLIDNAIKYSEKGDKVYIGSKVEDDKCVLWIEDTGPGIPKAHINRIFERFYRVDNARSRSRGGTGLGLAIVKHIVISFHGEIYVESELDKGTKFTVKIPLIERTQRK